MLAETAATHFPVACLYPNYRPTDRPTDSLTHYSLYPTWQTVQIDSQQQELGSSSSSALPAPFFPILSHSPFLPFLPSFLPSFLLSAN